jgi:hypothetical protein
MLEHCNLGLAVFTKVNKQEEVRLRRFALALKVVNQFLFVKEV